MREPNDPSEVVFDGRLLSGRRPVGIAVLLFMAIVLAVGSGSSQLAFATAECCFLIVALRYLVPSNPVWHDRVQLGIGLDGISIVRRGMRYSASWSTFDEAQLARLRRWLARTAEPSAWKLTLMNARKPTISTFIHADAAQAMFMFPVEFAFDAQPDEVRDLGNLLGTLVMPPSALPLTPSAGS